MSGVLALLTALFMLAAPWVSAGEAPFGDETVRGIVVSTHTSGFEWGTDAMRSTTRDLRDIGANWVAWHPYAGIGSDGSVRFHAVDADEPPMALVRPIYEAHARGMRALVKPHLAYWGSRFSWRGDIAFETEAEWARFWRDYERWIVTVAAACRDADAFVIGTELKGTLAFETEWRRIIAAVRAVTDAPLIYGANWDSFADVPFWDALDAIGIQAYFPITEIEAPTVIDLESGWDLRMSELRAYAEAYGKPIVFTELGYNRAFTAAARPWEYRTDGNDAAEFQEQCLRVALRAIESEPAVIGSFLWKWFPNPRPVGRNFQLATPRLKATISGVWLGESERGGGDSESK